MSYTLDLETESPKWADIFSFGVCIINVHVCMVWSPVDDQSILIETLSCNHQFFSVANFYSKGKCSHGVTVNSLYLHLVSFQLYKLFH